MRSPIRSGFPSSHRSRLVTHPTPRAGPGSWRTTGQSGARVAAAQGPAAAGNVRGAQSNGDEGGSSSLVVMSLSSDPGALALGPQLAVFAASLGIPTALVIGPQQDANAAATLRTACAAPPPAASKRSGHLQVVVSDEWGLAGQPAAELTVVVAVVDSRTPQLSDTIRTTTTVLGVSAGAATAEQLALAAVSAAADGREVAGILVADPESSDHTTGYVPQLAQPMRHRLPTRLTSTTTEIRR